MLIKIPTIFAFTLLGVVSFTLGSLWAASNPVLLPHDDTVVQGFKARAANDMARHFKWSVEGKAAISKRAIIAIRQSPTNCIVFAARQHGDGEWSYQACYSDDAKLLGLKAF